jgi:hypothetical protein
MDCGNEKGKNRLNWRLGRYVYPVVEEDNFKMGHKGIGVRVSSGFDTLMPG